jgi:hypothetical protein
MPPASAIDLFRTYGSASIGLAGALHGSGGVRTLGDRERAKGLDMGMSRVGLAAFAACLMAMPVSGCSLSQPAPRDFTLVDQRSAKAEEAGNSLEEAEKACKEETERKGIGSVIGLMSRLRKGAADEDYVACMKGRGYEVKP